MENPIYIALSRQAQLRREMSIIANNIANSDTTAFKREMNINEAYDERMRYGEKLAFVIDIGTAMDLQEGNFDLTGNNLDFGIRGPGYFMVDDGTSVKYTRNGSFTFDSENRLVTKAGYLVLDEDENPIIVPPGIGAPVVAEDGSININGEEFGRLGVVEFEDERALEKSRDSLFVTDQQPLDPDNSRVVQGALEDSNVNPILELTNMIEVHRAYDSVKNFLDKEGERQRDAARRLARPLQGGA